jgi:hypothetical protein
MSNQRQGGTCQTGGEEEHEPQYGGTCQTGSKEEHVKPAGKRNMSDLQEGGTWQTGSKVNMSNRN